MSARGALVAMFVPLTKEALFPFRVTCETRSWEFWSSRTKPNASRSYRARPLCSGVRTSQVPWASLRDSGHKVDFFELHTPGSRWLQSAFRGSHTPQNLSSTCYGVSRSPDIRKCSRNIVAGVQSDPGWFSMSDFSELAHQSWRMETGEGFGAGSRSCLRSLPDWPSPARPAVRSRTTISESCPARLSTTT